MLLVNGCWTLMREQRQCQLPGWWNVAGRRDWDQQTAAGNWREEMTGCSTSSRRLLEPRTSLRRCRLCLETIEMSTLARGLRTVRRCCGFVACLHTFTHKWISESNRRAINHTLRFTHSILTAIFPGEPGLAATGCPLNSPSPFIPGLHILLGQAWTFHVILNTIPPGLFQLINQCSKSFNEATDLSDRLRSQTCDQQIVGFNAMHKLFVHVPLSPSSIIWWRPMGGDARRLGR